MPERSTTYLLVVATCLGANLAFGSSILAQTAPNPDNAVQAKPRLRATFFEEERRLRQFGFGDFLRSALDSEQNAFADPAKVSNFEDNFNPLYARPGSPGTISGTLSVTSTNANSPNFLESNFNSAVGNLQFRSVNFETGNLTVNGTDSRIGELRVNGTITANGQTITFVDTPATYNAGINNNNTDNDSGVILVTDLNNPNQSLYIQIPSVDINADRIPPTPASLSIGLPSDR